jgi:CTP synthase (UTP-ammonia lyase)
MSQPLRIGIIGDFKPDYPSHIATIEALQHAANALSLGVNCSWLPTPFLDDKLSSSEAELEQYDGLWCAPGSPYQSMSGALKAIQYAREHDRPYVGT